MFFVFFIVVYVVMIFSFWLGLLRVKRWNRKTDERDLDLVQVSVIVAFRNEEQNLPILLKGLCSQSYPLCEAVFVNDYSDDDSERLVRSWQCNCEKRVIKADCAGKKPALAKGMKEAKGEIFVFTDGDCRVDTDFLRSIVSCMQRSGTDLCMGNVLLAYPKLFSFSAIEALEFSSLLACTAGAVGIGVPFMANGANLAVRRNVATNAGLKHEYASGDDVFLLESVIKQGGKVGFNFSTEATVYTKAQGNLQKFIAQRLRWASKTKGYGLWTSKLVALIVWFANFSLLMTMVLQTDMFVKLFFVKIMADALLLITYLKQSHRLELIVWHVVVEFFYIFYAIFIGILSQFVRYEWKGRKYRAGYVENSENC